MIPKRAIEKAIEGGWIPKVFQHCAFAGPIKVTSVYEREVHFKVLVDVGKEKPVELKQEACLAEIALDPSFWQALGKALGWADDVANPFYVTNWGGIKMFRWQYRALQFTQLILTGGSTDAFWDEILPTQEK